ncbi:MAG: Rieske 2Fe-2S domain-containing protein [Chloroflexi bacterium]|nr:MAG: Rieske 2Fe-2S domain-containing protein [Chloroflexota bacterium]
MSNYQVEPVDQPKALTREAIKALRNEQVQGLSRRQMLRRSVGGAVLLWLGEVSLGTVGFLWPNLSGGFGAKVKIGTYNDIKLANSNLPINEGFPAYYPEARAFVILIDPARQEFIPGTDTTGDGHPLNVRGLYQRCPHLGCRPNPCLKNFWFECPCHGSRYDRLGIKADGARFGPAPRSMDRFSATVDSGGVLTLDTGKITKGPLPVALGQPGLIPPKSPTGCI